MEGEAFYLPAGDQRYCATICAQGPWDPAHQYGGAVAALLACEAEHHAPAEGFAPTRMVCDFLGPVPLGNVEVTVHKVREGRSLQLVQAELTADGTCRARLTGWWARTTRLDLPHSIADESAPAIPAAAPHPRPPFGYLRASERRFVHGEFLEPGPAFMWSRTLVPLVAGAPTSPLQRLLINADLASGASAVLDWTRFAFFNVDLTLHLLRLPATDWIGLDAVSETDEQGIGLTTTRLFDEKGRIGTAAQSLFVAAR